MKEIQLKVMEALQEEAYKGIIRIDSETMKQIGVRPGDVIEIEGERTTVGIVDRAYPTDIGNKVIRMDGVLRRNARTSIGEIIKIRKAEIKEAKNLTIAPAQKGIMVQAHPEVFKNGLLGRALVKGDLVSLGGTTRRQRTLSGSPFEDIFDVFEQGFMGGFSLSGVKFMVADTNPKQPVIVTEETSIKVSPKAIEVSEEKVFDVTYEDVGGLEEEVKQVRELVEVPLRHPEIFETMGIQPPKGVLLHGPPGTGKTLIAKAVANEAEANFMLINGPEIMNKFYGECVAEDSIVLTNGTGLTSIKEAITDETAKHIAGLDFKTQKTKILPISDKFDKGKQNTLDITTPHGTITLTPTSKLLKLNDNLDLEWSLAKDIKEKDMVAVANEIQRKIKPTPNILDFISDVHVLKGKYVRSLLDSINLSHDEITKKINTTKKSFQDRKYGNRMPSGILKKLKNHITFEKEGEYILSFKGKLPSKINKKLMYVLGLIAGDGHLRYNYKDNHVSTIHFSNQDQEVIKKYKEYIKDLFGLDIIKQGKYDYYFSSSAIGNLLHNLGTPVRKKSRTLTIPPYILELDEDLMTSYLRGLYDSDGYVHLPHKGKQIIYYTMSKKMANGLRMVLLSLKIQSTIRQKKDGTHEIMISDIESINNFKKKIGFTHTKRKRRMNLDIDTKYQKPSLDRIPVTNILKKIIAKSKISQRYLLKNKINLTNRGISRKQIKKLLEILKKNNVSDKETIEKLSILKNNNILWSPVRKIRNSTAQVYDFTVPEDHNFIANGFIVHNSEKRIRDIFEEAEKNSPSIIFIDEIDALAPKREDSYGEVERRVVSQLLTVMDGLKSRGKVVVIGATNRPNALDPALRRPGRFDREIVVGIPNKKGRLNILKIHTRNMPLTKDVNLDKLAEITHGFVGADLEALCKEAAMNVLRKVLPKIKLKENEAISREILTQLNIGQTDFKEALKVVRPSAMREVLVETPNVKWKDIGGLDSIKQELKEAVELPLKNPKAFSRLGIKPPKGILLYGPPGTGKTLIAKAVANEAESNFILVKGPELLNKFVGESEKGVRKIFEKARQTAPTIIFFDELDSLAPKRGAEMGSRTTENVVNTILAEMDGLEEMQDVVVLAASVTGDTPILIKDKIGTKLLPIKDFIDQYYEEGEEGVEKPIMDIESLGFEALNTEKGNGLRFKNSAFNKVRSVFRHKVDKIYEIDYLGGKIRATGNHSVFVRTKRGIEAKPVSTLKEGDYLVDLPYKVRTNEKHSNLRYHNFKENFNLSLPVYSNNKKLQEDYNFAMSDTNLSQTNIANKIGFSQAAVSNWKRGVCVPRDLSLAYFKHQLPKQVIVTPQLMRLFGYYVAEGYARKEIDFCFNINETGYINDVQNLMKNIFGLKPHTLKYITENAVNIVYHSKPLADFFIEHCGKGAHNKHIPSFLFEAPKEYFLEFLRGHIAGDGHINKRGQIEITSVSRQLIMELNWLCRMHGIKSYISKFVSKPGRKIRDQTITKESIAYRLGISNCNNPFNNKTDSKNHSRRAKIKSIKTIPYNDYVYDLCGCENEAFFGGESPILLHNTNRPDIIDNALLRPGRLDRLLLIPPPNKKSRHEIFKIHTSNMPLEGVNLDKLAEKTDGYVGSDIESVCREAALLALRDDIKADKITMKYFEKALKKVRPSISKEALETYQKAEENYLKNTRIIPTTPDYMG